MEHSVLRSAPGRMSRLIIFAVLCVAPAALAEFDYKTCQTLNVIKNVTHLLNPHQFSTKLKNCGEALNRNVSLTNGTTALLRIYNAMDKHQTCSFTPVMENKLIDCVTSTTGYMKDDFTLIAKKHFGLNITEALVFNTKQCAASVSLSICVGKIFSEEKVIFKLKGCKDNIIRGFHVTAIMCHDALIHFDNNRGLTYLPSSALVFGTAAMLAKLAIFSLTK